MLTSEESTKSKGERDMLGFISKLLPKEYRGLLALGQQIFDNLDTKEERAEALAYIKEALADGQVTVPEWGRILKKRTPRAK